MSNKVLLEICVESIAHAVAAVRGGADRIELCTDLFCGGVTPSAALMRAARQELRIPVHGLIRPRPGNFCYADREFETIQREIDLVKEIGLDGIVVGVLDQSSRIDRERTRLLVQRAHPLPVTFHRAFDQCPDLNAAMEAVVETGATRLLTSGGKDHAEDGVVSLQNLVKSSRGRISVMPGGGIRLSNLEEILRCTSARELHTSLGASGAHERLFEAEVRKFSEALARFSTA